MYTCVIIDAQEVAIDAQKIDNKDTHLSLVDKFTKVMTACNPYLQRKNNRRVTDRRKQVFIKNTLFGEPSSVFVQSRPVGEVGSMAT